MPVALPFIALALTAVGTGVAVSGALSQGKAAEDAAKYNAKVEENNALAAQQQAEAEARQIDRQNRIRAGSQRAAYGKAGVDLSSLNDVYYDTGQQGELESLSALYAGATQSQFYNSRAVGARFEGQNARSASNINAASSLIGGLAQGTYIANQQFGRQPAFRPQGPTYKNLGS